MWATILSFEQMQREPIEEAIPAIRKERLRNVTGLSVMRFLLPLHDRCTRVLVRLPVNARQVTVLWLLVSLSAYGITTIGTPWAFVAGALLLYVAIILDLSDGEVGRYRARFMTPEQDLTTFINGMYLDRICHIMTSPLWPLAIALGLYRLSGQPLVFAAGVCLLVHQSVRRFRPLLKVYLIERFRLQVAKVMEEGGFADLRERAETNESLLARVAGKFDLWLRNGKRFNFLILVSGLVDCIISCMGEPEDCLVLNTMFLVSGAVAIVLVIWSVLTALFGRSLVIAVCNACSEEQGRHA